MKTYFKVFFILLVALFLNGYEGAAQSTIIDHPSASIYTDQKQEADNTIHVYGNNRYSQTNLPGRDIIQPDEDIPERFLTTVNGGGILIIIAEIIDTLKEVL